MKQINFVVECVVTQSERLFVVRSQVGQIVKYTFDNHKLADFFDEVCNNYKESEGK